MEKERYWSSFLVDQTAGPGLGKASEVLALGTKFRRTLKNSVFEINDVSMQFFKTNWQIMGTGPSPALVNKI